MPEQPRPQEVVAAEAGLMVAMGTDPGFATHVAGLSAGEVAVEIAGQLPAGTPATEMLERLMESGPDFPAIQEGGDDNGRYGPEHFPEYAAFAHRFADHLGLTVTASPEKQNPVAMAAVFGVSADEVGAASSLASNLTAPERLGVAVAGALEDQNGHDPMDPADPALFEDALAGVKEVDWKRLSPEDKVAATNYFLGRLANLGFDATLTPRGSRNG